jgi:O-antigen/teichoic acid export membrane protein
MSVFDINARALVVKNTAYLFASFLLNQGLRFFYIIIIARILEPEDLGLLTYGQSWYMSFLPFCMLGLGAILIKAVAIGGEYSSKVTNHVFSIRILSVILCAILCAGIGVIWHQSYEIIYLTLIFAIALVGRGAWLWCENMFIAYENAYYKFQIEKYLRPVELILAIAIAAAYQDIIFIAIGHAFVWLIQGGIGVYLVFTKVKTVSPKYSAAFSFTLLRKAWPMAIAVIADMLVLQLIFIVYKNIGGLNSEIANLSINIQILIIASSVFSAFNQSISPNIAVAADKSPKDLTKFLVINIYILTAFTLLAFFLADYLGAPSLLWLLSDKYIIAANHLPIILLLILPYVFKYSAAVVFQGLGVFKQTLVMNVITLIAMLVSLPILFSEFGYVGAIWSLLIAYSLSAIYALGYFYVKDFISIRKHLLIPLLTVFLFSIANLIPYELSDAMRFIVLLSFLAVSLFMLHHNFKGLKNELG